MPVLAGNIDPDFTENPIKGKLVQISTQTHLPVLAGILDPDFIEKPINGGAGYRTRG